MKKICDTHPYYEEIFEFSSMTVANMSLLMHAAATKTIRDFAGFVNRMNSTNLTGNISGKINDHSMMKTLFIASYGSNEVVILHKTKELFDYLAGLSNEKPNDIVYSVQPKEDWETKKKQSADNDITSWSSSDPTRRFEILTAYIIGGSFERCYSNFKSKYGNNPSSWHPELQFFRHLRNGCFHSNHFNVLPYRGSNQINTSNPPAWNNIVMTSDNDMNGKKVINGVFHVNQVIPFLDDMGKYV